MPVIAMSGGGKVDSKSYLEVARALGAFATIAKPFDLEHLLATVRDAIASRKNPRHPVMTRPASGATELPSRPSRCRCSRAIRCTECSATRFRSCKPSRHRRGLVAGGLGPGLVATRLSAIAAMVLCCPAAAWRGRTCGDRLSLAVFVAHRRRSSPG
jgi:hypothetical protein